MKGYEKNK